MTYHKPPIWNFTSLPQLGFSLIEMAVVLAIVALLLGGLLPSLSSQMEQAKRNETRKQMDEISAALIGYALTQTPPKLPCPAKGNVPTGTTFAGLADCTIIANASAVTGVIPWVTLGTSETDAWGRRFTYSIASSTSGSFGTSFTLSSTGTINVLASTGGSSIASNLPAAFISHGPNGLGAYLPTGVAMSVDATSTDEVSNNDGFPPFVSHDNSPNFDDLVVWISPNILFNRMVAAGKLP